MNLSRRTILASAAALPALAVPAVAAPDPILPKIERCKSAWAVYGIVCEREPTNDCGLIACGTPEYSEWEEHEGIVQETWSEAFNDMIATRPTTRAGALAMIDCFLLSERDDIDERSLALLGRLHAYLQTAA